ncbi:2-oxoglutarate and iron-dependent oxygenase JMJD4 homolog isoform X1 [Ostrinia furnacalis]|uniref:2-oxoglutarate and iron-dependent oxygenase JMJD4 homolog isoform X1 n=1 Tax=Ostrinia furnacalis TaxID=93504 RepID=UPI0010393032|nr:2-oxoglutarate and iron-dependent oxygenase JMJD4 homolog isoform X1 [Ostrinia furnacalis]
MSEIEIDDFNISALPECYDYNLKTIEVVGASELSYNQFFNKFMTKNIPCIIKNIGHDWICTRKWKKDAHIDHDYFIKTYGDLKAPVADFSDIMFDSHSKTDMKVCDYMNYLKSRTKEKLLYLKDWHLRKLRPDDNFYEVPIFFAPDWLNEHAQDCEEDDYMFVYIGPTGTWTPLHADVYRSFSWSINIIGRKKWILFPPGEETKLKDKFGRLPMQFNEKTHPGVKYFEVTQDEGDAIFVPSCWYHEVHNLLDTVSINHNWINCCNVGHVWEALQNVLITVELELADIRHEEDFLSSCQNLLKADFGMDFTMFTKLLCHMGKKRLDQLKSGESIGFNNYSLGPNQMKLDLLIIADTMDKICYHPLVINECIMQNELENELITTKNSISQYLST